MTYLTAGDENQRFSDSIFSAHTLIASWEGSLTGRFLSPVNLNW